MVFPDPDLRGTQRDIIIREKRAEAGSFDDLNASNKTTGFPAEQQETKEKSRFFVPKCILLTVCIMAILAGLIYLIIEGRSQANNGVKRGQIVPETLPPEECPSNIYTFLGEELVIKCSFKNKTNELVEAVYSNLVGATTNDFVCFFNDGDQRKNLTCNSTQTVSCSHHGNVIIRFYLGTGNNKVIKYTKTVKVTVLDTSKSASITQVFQNGKSEFHLYCEYQGFCTNYEVGFYGRDKISIAANMDCSLSYSNSGGYHQTCNAVVSSQVVYDYGNGTGLYCFLTSDGNVRDRIELELPRCDDISNDTACDGLNKANIDCAGFSSVADYCDATCKQAEKCFSTRWKQDGNSQTNPTSCSSQCTLDWCRERDTLKIDTPDFILGDISSMCNYTIN